MKSSTFKYPGTEEDVKEEAALPTKSDVQSLPFTAHAAVEKAIQIEGVEGAGIGQDEVGNEILIVYLRNAETKKVVPAIIDGKRVQIEVTGPITAQHE